MARNGAGIYSLPAGYLAVNGTNILPTQHNLPLVDIETEMNLPRPVTVGGTGANTAAGARANLGFGLSGAAFFATASGSQTFGSNNTWITLTFDTEVFDPLGMFTANTFTAPTAGLYLMGGSWVTDLGTPADVLVGMSVNAAAPENWHRTLVDESAVGDTDTTVRLITVLSLAENDTVNLQGYRKGGSINTTTGNRTVFWGVRLG